MNLLNLPMETSAVVKKLTPITVGAGESAEGGGATSAKGTGKTGKSKLNPNLAVKAELAQVESLKIQLKDSEAKAGPHGRRRSGRGRRCTGTGTRQ